MQPHVIVGFITASLASSLTGSDTDGYFLVTDDSRYSLHLLQASRTLFLQSIVDPPSPSNIDPGYLNY